MKNVQVLAVDPQNDFCVANGPGGEKGALVVGGALDDMNRAAAFITKNASRITDINCSLDSHQVFHIAHPPFWRDSKGNNPSPFTVISVDDVKKGVWTPFNPSFYPRALAYVETLAKNGRYALCIWPIHCRIGSWGQSVVPVIDAAFAKWELDTYNKVNYVPKGSNIFTENYSVLMADVVDPNDRTTKLNTDLIDIIVKADEILIIGEALSHCVANTVTDLANNFGDDNIKKLVLLTDTSSNVGGFEKLGQDFVKNMVARGMKLSTTKDW